MGAGLLRVGWIVDERDVEYFWCGYVGGGSGGFVWAWAGWGVSGGWLQGAILCFQNKRDERE